MGVYWMVVTYLMFLASALLENLSNDVVVLVASKLRVQCAVRGCVILALVALPMPSVSFGQV